MRTMLHELLLQQLCDYLKAVHGLKGIVLGGSYASGSQRPDSDLDIGLYYNENQPLDSVHLRSIASILNDAPNPTVTDLGGWGTWVNGGAWLTIGSQRVDLLYRNIDFRSEEHTSELQSHSDLVCRLLLEKKKSMTSSTLSAMQTSRDAHCACSDRSLARIWAVSPYGPRSKIIEA